jgi:hypothetical protein
MRFRTSGGKKGKKNNKDKADLRSSPFLTFSLPNYLQA